MAAKEKKRGHGGAKKTTTRRAPRTKAGQGRAEDHATR